MFNCWESNSLKNRTFIIVGLQMSKMTLDQGWFIYIPIGQQREFRVKYELQYFSVQVY